jgi:hypothetical protein
MIRKLRLWECVLTSRPFLFSLFIIEENVFCGTR